VNRKKTNCECSKKGVLSFLSLAAVVSVSILSHALYSIQATEYIHLSGGIDQCKVNFCSDLKF